MRATGRRRVLTGGVGGAGGVAGGLAGDVSGGVFEVLGAEAVDAVDAGVVGRVQVAARGNVVADRELVRGLGRAAKQETNRWLRTCPGAAGA